MIAPQVAIIDYGLGNVKSIANALTTVGAKTILTSSKKEILNADALVLPGVGAFSHGMEQLKKYDLIDAVYSFVSTNKPFLGICLGMQMMFDRSNEFSKTEGLGLIKGNVEIIEVDTTKQQRLPHTGWNNINTPQCIENWENTILSKIPNGTDMYFVHSYAAKPISQDQVLATTRYYGQEFCSAVMKGKIYGVQFHPEKSAGSGLQILKSFIDLT